MPVEFRNIALEVFPQSNISRLCLFILKIQTVFFFKELVLNNLLATCMQANELLCI